MVKSQFQLMAQYNALMNRKIIESLSLSTEQIQTEAELWEDKGAFFGSILGTLNHILVGDLIWIQRFNAHPNHPQGFKSLEALNGFPVPKSLDQILFTTLTAYKLSRELLDAVIISFVDGIEKEDYKLGLTYVNTKGDSFTKPFGHLLQHLFNHQTHHRGQVTTLLNQVDIGIGSTDLLMLIN